MAEYPWNPQPSGGTDDQLSYLQNLVNQLTQSDPLRFRGANIDTTMYTPMSVERNWTPSGGAVLNPGFAANLYGAITQRQANPQIDYAPPLSASYPNLQAAGQAQQLYQQQAAFPGQLEMQQAQVENEQALASLNRAKAEDPFGAKDKQAAAIVAAKQRDENEINRLTEAISRAQSGSNALAQQILANDPSFTGMQGDPIQALQTRIAYLQRNLKGYEKAMSDLQAGNSGSAYSTMVAAPPAGGGGGAAVGRGIPSLNDLVTRR